MSPPNPAPAPSSAPESFELTLPDDPASAKDWYLWAGVLALLVLVVFYPAINGTMLWDDDHHVGLAGTLQGTEGLAKIWTPKEGTPQYYPLTFTTYWLEQLIWHDSTFGYHLDNMLLHAASAVLVWRLLRRLKLPGAWLAAAIWAIHPIQAESVDWMSERKNVLSGLLFFASIWLYLDFTDADEIGAQFRLKPKSLAYAVSLVLLTLGLLAKTVVCAMPAVMLILFWWRREKIVSRKVLLPLIPFFAVGLYLSAQTVYLETAPGGNVEARGPDWAISPMQRVLIAGRGAWFYVGKLAWPEKLTFSYPRVLPDAQTIGSAAYAMQWVYVLAAIALVVALWFGRNRLGRGPLAAVLFYGVALFPSLGFINIYPMRYSFVADHFQYLAGLGLIVLAVAAIGAAMRKVPTPGRVGLAAVVVAACCVLSWRQSLIYQSPVTLYLDTLAKNPGSWMASHNLASEYVKLGQQQANEALTDKATGQPEAAADDTQQSQDYYRQAEQLFHNALSLHPSDYTSYTGLGVVYELTGRYGDAEKEMRLAVDADDQDDPMHRTIAPYVDYARALQLSDPNADVLPWLQKAAEAAHSERARISPRDVATMHLAFGDYWSMAAAKARKAKDSAQETDLLNRAIDELKQGLQTLPGNIAGQVELGKAYQGLSALDFAAANQALAQGRPRDAADFEDRGINTDMTAALGAYNAALAANPNHADVEALLGLGQAYYSHTTVDHDIQYPLINDLLLSMKFFRQAEDAQPGNAAAAGDLKLINARLMEQGGLDDQHDATWQPLKDKLTALSGAALDKDSVATADTVVFAALWPMPQNDALRPPLAQFHSAALAFASTGGSAESSKNVRAAAANVLTGLTSRDAERGRILDALSAALCYEGAVTAGDHDSVAWRKLQATADVLAKAAAAHSDSPDIQRSLMQAQFVLDQQRAATQPATQPIP